MGNQVDKSISIVIPAYNEEGNIEKVIKKSCQVFSSLFADKFEIIVVNDGSKDRTGEIAQGLADSIKNLKVYHHPANQGMGAAVRTGLAHSRNDLIFITCADLQFDIEEFEKFMPFIDRADIVVGYRITRDYNLYRKINTAIYRFLINLLFGLGAKDPSWVKVFKKKIFDQISITDKGFFWDVEVLVKAKRKGYIIKEVGVHSYQRQAGKSSAISPTRIIKTFLAMLKFWRQLKFRI